ncbi:hypothetical protein AGMMS49545_23560 [Betaproteobacteria bacterium]|nr:hypothetical protein AGMMS49545_23560 [Betaproteobacteria bacterium]GHU48770.1 hypothetical protein AGMMS50289_25690 [Betaproteobacteria bacterium]
MSNKIFHNLLKEEIKKNVDEMFFRVNNDGTCLKKSTAYEGGFRFRYLASGTLLSSQLYFNNTEIDRFIMDIDPKYTRGSYAQVAMNLWDAKPMPNMVDPGGHILVPSTANDPKARSTFWEIDKKGNKITGRSSC